MSFKLFPFKNSINIMSTCQSKVSDSLYENGTLFDCSEPAVALMQCENRFVTEHKFVLRKYMCRFHVAFTQKDYNYYVYWRMIQDLGFIQPTREEHSEWIKTFDTKV